MRHITKTLPVLALLLFIPAIASAHTGIGQTTGFWHGFTHPLSGVDHLLAMLAVGIWAAQSGKKAIWAVPTAFVSVMILGAMLGLAGVAVPFIETGIMMSVLILGTLIAAAIRLPLFAAIATVGLFAIFHGYAHGEEMPVVVSGFAYGAGFAIATAMLHLGGIALGLSFQKMAKKNMVRYAGASVALAGLFLFLS